MAKSRKSDAVPNDRRPSRRSRPTDGANRGEIARRAYALYLARGCEHGHDVDDWLRAERELKQTIVSAV
jgi:hypothetical protein